MDYTTLREVSMDGDILFLKVDKRNFLSRLTSWFTKSQYTHAAFLFWLNGRLMIVESTTHGGQRVVNASVYSDRQFDIVRAPKRWDTVQDIALAKIGTVKYGWLSAIYLGIRDFMNRCCNVSLPVDKNNRNKACSEFVAESLQLEDVDLSPNRLYRYLVTGRLD